MPGTCSGHLKMRLCLALLVATAAAVSALMVPQNVGYPQVPGYSPQETFSFLDLLNPFKLFKLLMKSLFNFFGGFLPKPLQVLTGKLQTLLFGQVSNYPRNPVLYPNRFPPNYPGGYPAVQPGGYPAYQRPGYPTVQPGGYPAYQPGGYPGAQQGGYPAVQPGGYPAYQPGGYPGAQQGGYPYQRFGAAGQQTRNPQGQQGGYPATQQTRYPAIQQGQPGPRSSDQKQIPEGATKTAQHKAKRDSNTIQPNVSSSEETTYW